MNRLVVNGLQVDVHDPIDDYLIKQKPSGNVEYFGISSASDVFVQFKSGKSYIYKGVGPKLTQELLEADSVGKFISKHLVNSFDTVRHNRRLVVPVPEEKAVE